MTSVQQAAGREVATAITVADPLVPPAVDGDVTAVLEPPPARPATWETELAAAVRAGAFAVARTELAGVDADAIATWLDRTLPRAGVTRHTRDSALSELLRLVHLTAELSGASAFRFRILVEPPGRRCGLHVDTVEPGLPAWGVLRVFNGAGTTYLDPADVTSMAAFYHWLQLRDRLVREEPSAGAERDARLARHDRRLPFLRQGAEPRLAPARTTVAFRHLDATLHWTDHDSRLAWVHSSPMCGEPRLVANVSPARGRGSDMSS